MIEIKEYSIKRILLEILTILSKQEKEIEELKIILKKLEHPDQYI